MAVAKETENLTELEKQFNRLAVCSRCQRTFTNPKILPCFHSFCLNCLKENRPATGNLKGDATANCPTCKAEFFIPRKGVADLPTNLFVEGIIATADALSSILQIASFQRTGRGKFSRHFGRSIKNFVRPGRVSNEDGRQSRASDKIQQKPFCKTHRQKFDRYCSNCTHVMCRLCNGKVHSNHRMISLDSAIKDLRQMINSYLIGVESCHIYYRAQNNICQTEREGWTAAATMNRMDSTPFRPDSRDRLIQIQSPLPSGSTTRNPETTRFAESWKECTRRFFVIITIRGLRGDILNIAKELHRLHETSCSQCEQENPVQQSQNKNSPSTRNHRPTSRTDIQNRCELEEKEQRIQKSLSEQREWMANEKRMEDIVKKQIEEKNYMEANLKEQRDWFAKSKPNIADNLHSKTIFQTPKVSQDKLEKEKLEAELRELRELNTDLQNELTQELHNEKRRILELEKLISWIERIDSQSAEFQMATEGHSDNGIIDKVQVSIVKKIKDLSEKNRLLLNRTEVLRCQMEETKSRASSERESNRELKALRDKEKQLLQKIEESSQQINELRQTSINDEKNHRKLGKEFARERDRLIEEIQQLKKDEKQLNARIQELENQIHNLQYALTQQKEFNHKAALIKSGDETSLKQHLEHSVAHKKELSLIQRELEHLIQWVDTIDEQSTDQITLDEKSQNGVVQKLMSSVTKKIKELKTTEKQLLNRIEESDRQITKLKQSLYSEQQKHPELRNSNERLQKELVEKERIRKVQEKQLNDMGNEICQLREMLKQQVEPKKSAREKLDQVSPTGPKLFTEVTKLKQQRLNTKSNFDDSTAVQIVANLRAPTGIRNMGNTCFFGATIQNLVYTVLLTEELPLNLSKQLQLDTELLLTKAYIEFRSSGYEAKCDQTFRHMFKTFCKKSSRFADRGQHDSHDLFVNFLNCFRDEERRCRGSTNSPGFRNVLTAVDKVFGGHTITVYVCSTCKTPYHVCEPFLDISVPILGPKDGGEDEEEDLFIDHLRNPQSIGGHDPVRQAVETTMKPLGVRSGLKTPQRIFQKRSLTAESMGDISLKQCLVYYSRTEQIHNEYLCNPCEAKGRPSMTSALKRTLIYNPPAVLVLHLKRFEQTTIGFKKCNQRVTYDEYLDIGPFCSSSCLRMREPDDANIWYSLYGVVVHKGSLTSGHYVSYIKVRDCDTRQAKQFMQQTFLNRDQVLNGDEIRRINASRGMVRSRKEWVPKEVEGKWYLADDEYVQAVEKTEALSQEAYLLFYERVAK